MKQITTSSHYRLDEEVKTMLHDLKEPYIQTGNRQKSSYSSFLKDKMLIIAAIRRGIPYSLFDLIQAHTPFSENDWADFLDISTKSLQRYKAAAKYRFKRIHSEKILELAEVTELGNEVFGPEKFKLWLHTPNFALGHFKPVELLKDSFGKELVINELTCISHGILV